MRSVSAVALALVCALVVACSGASPATQTAPAAAGQPSVTVSAPLPGATVFVGAEVPVLISATDTVGVSRVDLSVDGVTVDTYTTPAPQGQPSVSAQLHWTPLTAGAHALTVTAYRQDGTASSPAVVAVTVSSQAGAVSPSAPVAGQPSSQPEPTGPAATETTAPATATPTATPTETPAPTPTRTPRPTRPPTPAPTATPRPAVIDLKPASYGLRTGNEVGVNYVFVDTTVKNVGNTRAGPFEVDVTCRGTTYAQAIDGLGPGKSVDFTFSFSADAAAGTDGASKVVADAKNQVTESREDNNQLNINDSPDPTTGAPSPCSPT